MKLISLHFCVYFTTVLILSTIDFSGATLTKLPNPKLEKTEREAFNKLLGLEETIAKTVRNGIRRIFPYVLTIASEVELHQNCVASLIKVFRSTMNLESWAFKLLDSTGRPPSGIFRGTINALGDYGQCLNVKEPHPSKAKGNHHEEDDEESSDYVGIKGQYCLVGIRPPLPPKPKHVRIYEDIFPNINETFKYEVMREFENLLFIFYDAAYKWGLCVPHTCTATDIEKVLTHVLSPLNVSSEVTSCEVKEELHVDRAQLIVIFVFGIIILFNVSGTVVQYWYIDSSQAKAMAAKIANVFSVKENFLRAVSTKRGAAQLDFLNGLRFISMTWVILGHCYIMTEKNLLRSSLNLDGWRKDIWFEPGSNTYLSVDSFIFIGGAVMAYSVLSMKRKVPSSLIIILCRIIRVLPCMMLTIGITLIVPLLGSGASGPFWRPIFDNIAHNCRKNWWTNMLFINNFLDFTNMCLVHTWYIPVDFHCFLLGLIFIYIYVKKPIYGKLYLIFMISGSILSTGIVSYIFEFPPTILLGTLMLTDYTYGVQYMKYSYTATHVHLSVYALGLIVGTIIAKNPKVQMSRRLGFVGWTVAAVSGLATVYGTHRWNTGIPYGELESVVYASLYRSVWGACLAWVCLACYFQRGGIVNYLLSFRVYKPLCRISYLTYLVQYFFVYGYVGTRQGPIDYSHTMMVYYFFGVLCLSSIAAFILNVLVETPIAEITKLIGLKLMGNPNAIKDAKTSEATRNGISNEAMTKEANENRISVISVDSRKTEISHL